MPQSGRLDKPVFVSSKIVHGFGRGSKKLGVPTANLEDKAVELVHLESGIYYGFVQLIHPIGSNLPKLPKPDVSVTFENNPENPIYPAVLSLGWNPHFNDVTKRTLEAHILHIFDYDFYDSTIKVAICGYIRPEKKFNSLEELIQTIHEDIKYTKEELKYPISNWFEVVDDKFFHVINGAL